MAKWLILLQTISEKPANITKWLSEFKQDYETIQLWEENIPADVDAYCGLIVMGGTMSANDVAKFPFITDEVHLIKKWLKTGKPLLGICLGAQLMAKALGKEIRIGKRPEIGWAKIRFTTDGASDSMFSDFSPEATVFEWHYDTFDLPHDTKRLASSDSYKNQAFRFRQNAYALQFHPEVDQDLIHSWIEMHREKLNKMNPYLDQKILAGVSENLEGFEKLGRHVISTLCRKIEDID